MFGGTEDKKSCLPPRCITVPDTEAAIAPMPNDGMRDMPEYSATELMAAPTTKECTPCLSAKGASGKFSGKFIKVLHNCQTPAKKKTVLDQTKKNPTAKKKPMLCQNTEASHVQELTKVNGKYTYCSKCYPPLAGKGFPFLVAAEGRTSSDTLDLWLEENPQDKPVYISTLFKPHPRTGKGPYFADTDFKRMLERIYYTPEGSRHWATVFRDGPTAIAVDVDRPLPQHLEDFDGRSVVQTIVTDLQRLIEYTFKETGKVEGPLSQLRFGIDAWVVAAEWTSKISIHLHFPDATFESWLHVRYFMEWARASFDKVRTDELKLSDIDFSIYRDKRNRLLKLPFQCKNKPGRPVMDIFQTVGGNPDDVETLGLCMAHSPLNFTTPRRFKVALPPDFAPEEKDTASRSRRIREMPPLLAVPEEIRYSRLQMQDIIDAVDPDAKSNIEFKGMSDRKTWSFYINYTGPHKCINGTLHDSNNAILYVQGKVLWYYCLSSQPTCGRKVRLGQQLLLEIPFPLAEKKRRLEEVDIAPKTYTDDPAQRLPKSRFTLQELEAVVNREKKTARLSELDVEELEEWEIMVEIRNIHSAVAATLNDYWCLLKTSKPVVADLQFAGKKREWIMRNCADMSSVYEHVTLLVPSKLAGGKRSKFVKYEHLNIYNIWKKAPNRRVAESLDFATHTYLEKPDCLNLWTGMTIDEEAVDKWVALHEYTEEQIKEQAAPWIEHIREIVCDGDEVNARFVHAYFRKVLVERKKTNAALVIIGYQGTGKSTVRIFIEKIIGPVHSMTIGTPTLLTGDFNAHLAGKIYVSAEEASFGGSKKQSGILKSLVTNPELYANAKFKSIVAIPSLINLNFFTNPQHTVDIGTAERRYTVVGTSNRFAGSQPDEKTTEYFDTLYNTDPIAVAAFYHRCCQDLSDYDLTRGSGVNNEATIIQKTLSASPFEQFIFHIIDNVTDQFDYEQKGIASWTFEDWQTRSRDWNKGRGPYVEALTQMPVIKQYLKHYFHLRRRRLSPVEGAGGRRYLCLPEDFFSVKQSMNAVRSGRLH